MYRETEFHRVGPTEKVMAGANPNSPDLHPVVYHVWSVVDQRVHRTRIHDITHLKARLVEEWRSLTRKLVIRQSSSDVHLSGHAFEEEDTLSHALF